MKLNVSSGSPWNSFISNLWTVYPVVLTCLLTFFAPRNQLSLWPFVLFEWILILLVCALFCPWLDKKGIYHLAFLFILAHLVSLIITSEYLKLYSALHTYSDDYSYLTDACLIGTRLKTNGFDLIDAWSSSNYHWTLSAWPFLLGLLSSFTNCEVNQVCVLALSLNAMLLVLGLILIVYFFGEKNKLHFKKLMLFFWLVAPELLIAAGNCRKEIFLILVLLLSFICTVNIFEKKEIFIWIIGFIFGLLGLALTRMGYIFIFPLLLILYWLLKKHLPVRFNLLIIGLLIFVFYSFVDLSTVSIREIPVMNMVGYGKMAVNDSAAMVNMAGMGYAVFHVPLIGPWIYYLLSPLPANPVNLISGDLPLMFISIIESIGTVCYLLTFGWVVYWLIKKRKQPIFFYVLVSLYVVIFALTVILSSEPRYKLPTYPLLAMLGFQLWLSKSAKNLTE